MMKRKYDMDYAATVEKDVEIRIEKTSTTKDKATADYLKTYADKLKNR